MSETSSRGEFPRDAGGADEGVAGLFEDEPQPVVARHTQPVSSSRHRSSNRNDRKPRRRRRNGPLLAAVLLTVLALLAALVGALIYGGEKLFGNNNAADYAGTGTGSVLIQVHSGDTASDIASTLATDGVVASSDAFSSAADSDDRSRSIQPGYYNLKMHMSAASALALLLNPASVVRSKVTVPEGSSLARTLELIAAKTTVPAAALKAAVANPLALGVPSYANGRVEGFLFPATYEIGPQTQAVDALQMFTQAFAVEAAHLDLVNAAAAIKRTPYQVVTVASLIEAEAAHPADRPKVAEVIYNRLKDGMPLGLESTVRYALGGVAGNRVLQSQLSAAAKSPLSAYDTYIHTGLPPGPIDNPGDATLTAALHPAAGSDLYFVTLPKTNQTVFTPSEATFEQLTAECRAQGGC